MSETHFAKNDVFISLILNDPNYDVREDGTIWTRWSKNGVGLIPDGSWRRADQLRRDGYRGINFKINSGTRLNRGPKKSIFAHRIIFAKYCAGLDSTLTVNHKNGDKQNNQPSNLELATMKKQNEHRQKVLGHPVINNFHLSFEIADEIRSLKRAGWTHKQLCAKYKISKGHVSEIVNNKIWVTPS